MTYYILRKLLLLYSLKLLHANRILFMMPHPSISHQIVARSLTKNLAQLGEVSVVTPRPWFIAGNTPSNITEVDISDSENKYWNEALTLISGKRKDSYYIAYVTLSLAIEKLSEQLKKPEVQHVLQEKFDLVVAEALFRPTVALSRLCNAPLVHFSTTGTLYITDFDGSLSHYLYYPDSVRLRIHNLSFWEKLTEFYDNLYYRIGFELTIAKHEKKVEEVFPFRVNETLRKDVQLTLLNTNALWDGNRPRPLTVVYVEGIHKPQSEVLPQELKGFLDSSVHGVIYVSFGTSVVNSRLPRDRILAMVKVLSLMPYDILWKWDGELPGSANNIRVFKWLPQADLLKHPNVKLFITQAGIHSTEEAINAGVPLLGLPLLADQWYNAEKYTHFKIGERLDLYDLTEETFKNKVETVINDKMYSHNIARLRMLIDDQPLTPEDRVSWAIQRARLRRAGAWMRAPSAHMSIVEYYELQLLSLVLIAVLLIVTLVVYVFRIWIRIVRNIL